MTWLKRLSIMWRCCKLYGLYFMVGAGVLSACKPSQPVSETRLHDQNSDRPEWVMSKPASALYYYGVGISSLGLPDYQEAAKKQALDDLASEISVQVESQSLLQQKEVGDFFSESYQGRVYTYTDQYIEGYERQDSWQDARNYYVIYRLSIQKHEQLISAKRKTVSELAKSAYLSGISAERQGQAAIAIAHFVNCLEVQSEYLHLNLEADVEGEKVSLASSAFGHIVAIWNGIRLVPASTQLFVAKKDRSISVKCFLVDHPALGVQFESGGNRIYSRENGKLNIPLESISYKPSGQSINLSLSKDMLKTQNEVIADLLDNAALANRNFDYQVTFPVLKIAIPSDYDQSIPHLDMITLKTKELFSTSGYEVYSDTTKADYSLYVDGEVTHHEERSGMHVVFITCKFRIIDLSTEKTIFSKQQFDLKGIHNSYATAERMAYQNAASELSKQFFSDFLNNY